MQDVPPEATITRARRSRSVKLAIDLPHDLRPAVDDRQHFIRLFRREHRHHAGDPDLCQALHPVQILAEAERGDLDGSRITAGFPGHLAEFRQNLGDIATGGWNPAITVADRAARPVWEGATDVNRRVGLLHRFGPGDHWVEVDELAMIFCPFFCPDFLHRLDRFAHPLEAGRVDGAVILHFILIPAAADAEQEAPPTYLIERGD